jgi:hypothetical protein
MGAAAAPGLLDRFLLLRSTYTALKRHRRDRRMLATADAVVVSFPKSGRTWVRVMLSRLCQIEWGLPDTALLEFDNLHARDARVPRVLFTHDVDAMVPAARLPADKSHYVGRPVTLLSRHPADIAVSRHSHLRHRSRDRARRRLAQAPLAEFVWSDYGGLPAIVMFLNQWAAAARAHPGITIQRYEDFIADPQAALALLARNIGIPANSAAIEDAVAFASFQNLKKKEAEGFFDNDRLRPRKAAEANSFKVRSGKAGGWTAQFEPEEAARIADYIARNLDPVFGYGTRQAAREAR